MYNVGKIILFIVDEKNINITRAMIQFFQILVIYKDVSIKCLKKCIISPCFTMRSLSSCDCDPFVAKSAALILLKLFGTKTSWHEFLGQ